MGKSGIVWERKRRRPCGPIGQDGEPKVAPNAVDRDFRRGAPLKIVSTDITYLPCMDEGFVCMSGILDCQTDVPLAHKCSIPMEERLVLDTYDQLRGARPSRRHLGMLGPGRPPCRTGLPGQAQGARDPAVHVQAGLLLGQCMHRELLGTDGGADGRHGASPSEEAMAPAGRHAGCCSDCRGQERLGWLTPMEHAGRFTA